MGYCYPERVAQKLTHWFTRRAQVHYSNRASTIARRLNPGSSLFDLRVINSLGSRAAWTARWEILGILMKKSSLFSAMKQQASANPFWHSATNSRASPLSLALNPLMLPWQLPLSPSARPSVAPKSKSPYPHRMRKEAIS
jgi:hypothetical protein